MLGTDQQLSAQENIEVTSFLEEKIIQHGKEREYVGIFSTNTNPLTQVTNCLILKSLQTELLKKFNLIFYCKFIFVPLTLWNCYFHIVLVR